MYSNNSLGIQTESIYTAPTAPPYPQPPPKPFATSERETTFTGVQVIKKDQPNNLPKSESRAPLRWSSGLCDCFDDIGSCCLTCCCPCVTFGRIAETVDRSSISCGVSGALYALIFCFTGCCCLYSCCYRSKLRGQYFLEESPCTDCCVHCCCEGCALCQEYRELMHRGFDMSIGWHGNMARQRRLAELGDGNA